MYKVLFEVLTYTVSFKSHNNSMKQYYYNLNFTDGTQRLSNLFKMVILDWKTFNDPMLPRAIFKPVSKNFN